MARWQPSSTKAKATAAANKPAARPALDETATRQMLDWNRCDARAQECNALEQKKRFLEKALAETVVAVEQNQQKLKESTSSLVEQREEARLELATVQQSLESNRRDRDKLLNELSDARLRMEKTQTSLVSAEAKLKSLTDEISIGEQNLKRINGDRVRLSAELDHYHEELAEVRERQVSAFEQFTTTAADIERLQRDQQQITKLNRTARDDHDARIRQLDAVISERQSTLKDLSDQHHLAEKGLADLHRAQQDASLAVEELLTSKTDLIHEIDRLERSKTHTQDEIGRMNKELEQATVNFSALAEKLEKQKEKNAEWEAYRNQLIQESDHLENLLKTRRQELERCEQETKSHQDDLVTLTDSTKRLREEKHQIEHDLGKLRDAWKQLQSENENLNRAIAARTGEMQSLNLRIADAKTDITTAEQTRDRWAHELTTRKNELLTVEQQLLVRLEELDQHLQKLECQKQAINGANEEFARLDAAVEEKKGEHERLQSAFAAESKELDAVREQRALVDRELFEIQNQLPPTLAQVAAAQKDLEKVDELRARLGGDCEKWEAHLNETKRDFSDLISRLQESERDLKLLEEELSLGRAEQQKLATQAETNRQTLELQMTRQKELDILITAMEAKKALISHDAQQREQQLEQLNFEVNQLEQTKSKLAAEVGRQREKADEFAELVDQLERLQAKVSREQSMYEESSARAEEIRRELNQKSAMIAAKEEQLADLSRRLELGAEAIREQEAHTAQKSAGLLAIQLELAKLESQRLKQLDEIACRESQLQSLDQQCESNLLANDQQRRELDESLAKQESLRQELETLNLKRNELKADVVRMSQENVTCLSSKQKSPSNVEPAFFFKREPTMQNGISHQHYEVMPPAQEESMMSTADPAEHRQSQPESNREIERLREQNAFLLRQLSELQERVAHLSTATSEPRSQNYSHPQQSGERDHTSLAVEARALAPYRQEPSAAEDSVIPTPSQPDIWNATDDSESNKSDTEKERASATPWQSVLEEDDEKPTDDFLTEHSPWQMVAELLSKPARKRG